MTGPRTIDKTPPPCAGCGWRKRCWKCKPAKKRARRYLQAVAVRLGYRAAEELSRGMGFHRDIRQLTGWELAMVLDRYAPRVQDPRQEVSDEAMKPSRRHVCRCGANKDRHEVLCVACALKEEWQGSRPVRLPDRSPIEFQAYLDRRGLEAETIGAKIGAYPGAATGWLAEGVPRLWAALMTLEAMGVDVSAAQEPMSATEFRAARVGLGIGIPGLAAMIGRRPGTTLNYQDGRRRVPHALGNLLRTLSVSARARELLRVPDKTQKSLTQS